MKQKYTYAESPVGWPEDLCLKPIREVVITTNSAEYEIFLDALMDYTLNAAHSEYCRSVAMEMITQMRTRREEL